LESLVLDHPIPMIRLRPLFPTPQLDAKNANTTHHSCDN
jgi:hypothetical protein